MNRHFSRNMVEPNLPLRKPSSSPTHTRTSSTHRKLSGIGATGGKVPPSNLNVTGGPVNTPVLGIPSLLGSVPPELTVHICNYCGEQGHFQCKCCQSASYCSIVCQTKDWKLHKHCCRLVDPETVEEKPQDITDTSVSSHPTRQIKPAHTPSYQRMYLKDLIIDKDMPATEFKASVLEFYSPGRFYVQGQGSKQQETLLIISKSLQKGRDKGPSMTPYLPCVGEICGVQFSYDLHWYRGLVQTLTADQKMAKILYIDFGNEENVPVDRIKPLCTSIKPFPPCCLLCVQAIECCIFGVVPSADTWSKECCLAVRQLLTGNMVIIQPLDILQNGHIHAVEVLLPAGNKLSRILLQHGFAKEEPSKPTQHDINTVTSVALENVKLCSDDNNDNSWARPPEPLRQAVGDSFSAVITHLQSPDEIIVQKVEQAGVIQELQLNLRDHCWQLPVPLNFRPAPGTVCCAQFSEDNQWYRAKVLSYPSEEHVCVDYLDFGNSEMAKLEHLRPISAPLLAVPIQAIPCGLAGVRPIGDRWSEGCLVDLQQRVSNRLLCIKIQEVQEDKVLVDMIDESSDPQANIAELLVAGAYAAQLPVTISTDQEKPVQPHVSTASLEPLWSFTEVPSDGQRVALLTSFVVNPGEFYCWIDNPKDRQMLRDVEAELKLHCEADNALFEPKVGEPCCAMCPADRSWYRAIVKRLQGNLVSVNLVDYGYTIQVERQHLRYIKPQLLTLPFQSLRCWLSGVEPLGSEWTSEAMLWFQNLVDGKLLSARFLCITEQGHCVELESEGRNVAAALISELLSKDCKALSTVTFANTGCVAKNKESTRENEDREIQSQASNPTSTNEPPNEAQAPLPPEAPSFKEDWKTLELPLKESFKPNVVAVISPSLFYLLVTSPDDQQKLQLLMEEIAAYCSSEQVSKYSAAAIRASPGAACCAQFSYDNKWYRAVILEVGENEISVVYADFGNTETVPFSRILPIPPHLLQLPFVIIRCSLAGVKPLPMDWPVEVKLMFRSTLVNCAHCTVQSFDGFSNVVSLTLSAESGGGDVLALVVNAVQTLYSCNGGLSSPEVSEQSDSSSPKSSNSGDPHCPQTTTAAGTGTSGRQDGDTSAELALPDVSLQHMKQNEPKVTVNVQNNDPHSCHCCCPVLETKIDHIEQELMKLSKWLMARLNTGSVLTNESVFLP
ncbi:tudor domain-containing protein 1 isoform X6 [Cynoglossus semilaevis]|nr:tudor domain-containing protein 1 isoform X6 [Cynoglossus semilaevis]XP_016890087.1 tudor domain-containing protein 1 isoform X6 [Cynoglossus semilaevis]